VFEKVCLATTVLKPQSSVQWESQARKRSGRWKGRSILTPLTSMSSEFSAQHSGEATFWCSTIWERTGPAASRRRAERYGAQVIWLAPYSPDFSPIELMWSKIKGRVRSAKARTREALERALVSALELVTGSDCLGWFRHCGYQVTPNRN
jgi:hypothetical protein